MNGKRNTSISRDEFDTVKYTFIAKDVSLYGIHEISIMHKDKWIKTNAKFDTGARMSSISIELAEALGVDPDILKAARNLEKVPISNKISKDNRKLMESEYSEKYSKEYENISSVQISKSASGFSIRPCIELTIFINNKSTLTEVNIKDRLGMKSQMLIGLRDLL